MSSVQWKKLSMLKIFWNDELSAEEKDASLLVIKGFMNEADWEQGMADALRLGLRVAA